MSCEKDKEDKVQQETEQFVQEGTRPGRRAGVDSSTPAHGEGDIQRGRTDSDLRRATPRRFAPPEDVLLLSDPAGRARVVAALARVLREEDARVDLGGFRRVR